MKICSNCGATNSDKDSLACRKCGALLPVQTRRRRITLPKPEPKPKQIEEEDDIKIIGEEIIPRQDDLELDISFEEKELDDMTSIDSDASHPTRPTNLQEIPKVYEKPQEQENKEQKKSKQSVQVGPNLSLNGKKPEIKPLPGTIESRSASEKSQVLQEITPQPYQGSILDKKSTPQIPTTKPLTDISKDTTPQPIKESEEEIEEKGKTQKEIKEPQSEEQVLEDSRLTEKQKLLELEEDMTKVLKFLSSKVKIKKEEAPVEATSNIESIEEKIKPSNLNEILKRLVKIDSYIEAGALIKSDGTILAAAISGRFSDSLFGTIGQNLSMIGSDIIQGLSAGTLESISIRGSEGILDLAPLSDKKSPFVKGIILMIFSHPKVKRGIIKMAVTSITSDIIEYLTPQE